MIGLEIENTTNISEDIKNIQLLNFNFISLPIFDEKKLNQKTINPIDLLSWKEADLLLQYHEWSNLIGGHLKTWSNCSKDDKSTSIKLMKSELSYATHLHLTTIFFNLSITSNILIISSILRQFYDDNKLRPRVVCIIDVNTDQLHLNQLISTYESLTILTDHIANLSVGLNLHQDDSIHQSSRLKLLGLPVDALFLSLNLFLVNKNGFPILSNSIKLVLRDFSKFSGLKLILKHEIDTKLNLKHISAYLRHIVRKIDVDIQYDSSYLQFQDLPQIPLQPLSSNLEACIYEVFEQDPVKYVEYQNAIYKFLADRVGCTTDPIHIMIVGAGRGPLVSAARSAADKFSHIVYITAIEQNSNAIPSLYERARREKWADSVEIIHADIRALEKPGYKADLVVSELLGSFGDNELSPECLDAAERFLKPNAVSIPSSYTSYLAPISAPVLYSQINSYNSYNQNDSLHCPYVCLLHTYYDISIPQPCFHFIHPANNTPTTTPPCVNTITCSNTPTFVPTNERFNRLTFIAVSDGLLHGFAGYFSCSLYKNISLSIHPHTYSSGMISWFPMFFPFKTPLLVTKNQQITISMWRRVSSSYIWYEWCLESPILSPIHNVGGKYYRMNL